MPHAEAPPAGTAEQFTARGASGRAVVIEKLAAGVRENDVGGLAWTASGVTYRLQGGGVVERIGESTFRIADTGEIVRREEGDHGITYHPQHQAPGRP